MKTLIGLLLVVVLSLAPFPATAQSETASANALYERAQRAYFDLKAHGERQAEPASWRAVLNAYALVIDSYPNDPLVDDITFIQGGVYREMYQLFGERPLLEAAIERYRTVIRDFPDSYLLQAALFAVADMQETHLKSPEAALETFSELMKRFPRGYKTAAARERVALIQRSLNKPERTASLEPVATGNSAKPVVLPVASEKNIPADAIKSDIFTGEGGLVTVRPQGRTVSREPAGIVDIRTNLGPSNGRVVIELDHEVVFSYKQLPAPNRRIYFDLENVHLARSAVKAAEIPVNSPYLKKIRLGQNAATTTRAVFDFDAFREFTIFTLPGPDDHFRIVMDLQGGGSSTTTAERTTTTSVRSQPVLSEGAKKNQNGAYTLSRQLGAKINRIVIDPGHGGHDPGTVGFKGLTEKSLNLDVAKRLQALIAKEMPGVEAIMTRDRDMFVSLDQRPAYSKAKEGDLFISIHSNYARRGKASGIETYYMNYASDAEAEELAARENALNQMNQAKLAEMVVRIMTNNKKEESKEFASFVQNHLYQQTRAVNNTTRNRGVKSAPFVVLIGTDVPSILVEIGFINHPTEGKLLLTESYRDRIARGLLKGITAYIESVQ